MFINFNSVFNPSKKEKIKQLDFLINQHEHNIGECCTCVYYTPVDSRLPGFVEDFGDCIKNCDVFIDVITRKKPTICSKYIESTKNIEKIIKLRKEIK